jgi:large subunit ribosomal protein L23
MRNPYDIIERRHITEKSSVLEGLQNNQSNKSVAKCKTPKYVFIVNKDASKPDIACAIETIYKEQKVKVLKVNTILVKPKAKRRGRGRLGATAAFKKAVVTLEEGDSLEKA